MKRMIFPNTCYFSEDVFPYYGEVPLSKGMKKIIQELQHFIKANTYGTASDRALLLDYQATLEPKTEKAIKLEKEALAQIKETTKKMPTCFQPPFQSWRALPNQRTT